MSAAKHILEGRPFKSPLHAALVHIPIALLSLGFLLDAVSWTVRLETWQLPRVAAYAIAFGIAMAVVAALPGLVDYTTIRKDSSAKKIAMLHMILNVTSLALFALSLGLRFDSLDAARTPLGALVASGIAFGVLSYSGYLGGSLVYEEGIGVGRHRRTTPLPTETVVVRSREGENRVLVGLASELSEGGTLRVNASGTLVTIARVDGRLAAFQEYCTHRYAPLSEGCLKDGEVVCPWHNSRFNVRTGAVVQGPAKVNLRTFTVEEHDGNIWLDVPPTPPKAASATPSTARSGQRR